MAYDTAKDRPVIDKTGKSEEEIFSEEKDAYTKYFAGKFHAAIWEHVWKETFITLYVLLCHACMWTHCITSSFRGFHILNKIKENGKI